MKILKQVVGVDVSQKELVVCFGKLEETLSIDIAAYKVFDNKEKGFEALASWVGKLVDPDISLLFVMEATGVYHQRFAYFLYEKGYRVSIVLPNKISNYIRTLEIKTITDKSCSEAITRFGLERKLVSWIPPKEVYRMLQQLTRERDQVVLERSMVKNQLHAEKAQASPHAKTLTRLQERIGYLTAQENDIKDDIFQIVNNNESLKAEVVLLRTIPGVGQLTAVVVLAETNGFELIRNKKQLTSYAGLDVKEKLSGTSVKGKPKISKRGNRSLRKALYLPSMSAVRWDENFKATYVRIVAKHGHKMKGLVAIQRRILELMYVLYKTKTIYDKDYQKKKENSVPAQVA